MVARPREDEGNELLEAAIDDTYLGVARGGAIGDRGYGKGVFREGCG